jgi:leucyl aminopeptidase
MEIVVSRTSLTEIQTDVLVMPVFEGASPREGALGDLNAATGDQISRSYERNEFSGERGTWVLFHREAGRGPARVLLYGAGKLRAPDSASIQRITGGAIRVLVERGAQSVAFALVPPLDSIASVEAAVEGALLGSVNSRIYQTEKPSKEVLTCEFVCPGLSENELKEAVRVGSILGTSTNVARLLSFDPSNLLTPTELSARAGEIASAGGLAFRSLDEDEMKELGMGALLAVSRGSQEPARLISLSYEPEGVGPDSELIALVGKGITFDSGGISIKPADKMDEMKYDMAGGAAVIGAMQAIAQLKPAARVLGLVPASENLPSGRAVKPGDVLRSLSGKTIEVANTDAEGRLVLCDAITYAIKQGARTIIDAATLTGAVVVALGEVRAGIMGNDQPLIDELVATGESCGERLWQLPMDKEYDDLIKSDIADVRNVGNRTGGSITAGWFLRHFVGDAKWAHMDIAGTGWTEAESPHLARGASGFGTRLMAKFVLTRSGSEAGISL